MSLTQVGLMLRDFIFQIFLKIAIYANFYDKRARFLNGERSH